MKPMGKKHKKIMIAYGSLLLCAVLLLLLHTLLIRTLNDRVQQQELEHSILSGEYQRLQAQLAEKYGQQDASKLQGLLSRLPVQADTSHMVRLLASLEADTGVHIESMTFVAETATREDVEQTESLLEMLRSGFASGSKDTNPQNQFPLPSINFSIQFTGTVTQLQHFLKRIHEMERIIVVENFDYQYRDDSDLGSGETATAAEQTIQGEVSLKALYADQFSSFIPGL